MSRNTILNNTVEILNNLSKENLLEVNKFAEYLLKKHEDRILTKGIEELSSKSKVFDFLKNEEETYSVEDLKEKYNEER